MRGLTPATIIVCGLVGAGAAAGGDRSVSLTVEGGQDAIVAYTCDFTDGGQAEGRVSPRWSNSWAAEGARCRFEQVVGERNVTIRLTAGGAQSTVSTSGRGSTVVLSIGRQRDDGI